MFPRYNVDRSELVRQSYYQRIEKAEAGRVAPHEGRELAMVLDGQKPLAVIELAKQPEQFHAAQEVRGVCVVNHDGAEGPEVIVTREPRLAVRYFWLQEHGVKRLGLKAYHRAMGELFGYSPADIEAFIAAEIQCDCSKCRGASHG